MSSLFISLSRKLVFKALEYLAHVCFSNSKKACFEIFCKSTLFYVDNFEFNRHSVTLDRAQVVDIVDFIVNENCDTFAGFIFRRTKRVRIGGNDGSDIAILRYEYNAI